MQPKINSINLRNHMSMCFEKFHLDSCYLSLKTSGGMFVCHIPLFPFSNCLKGFLCTIFQVDFFLFYTNQSQIGYYLLWQSCANRTKYERREPHNISSEFSLIVKKKLFHSKLCTQNTLFVSLFIQIQHQYSHDSCEFQTHI